MEHNGTLNLETSACSCWVPSVLTLQGTPNSPTPVTDPGLPLSCRAWPIPQPGLQRSQAWRLHPPAPSALTPWPRSSPAQGPEGVPCERPWAEGAARPQDMPHPPRGAHTQGPVPARSPCTDLAPSESAEASALTAPQVKFPPCGPAPLLPHRMGFQTPPPPPVDSSSGFLPETIALVGSHHIQPIGAPSPCGP